MVCIFSLYRANPEYKQSMYFTFIRNFKNIQNLYFQHKSFPCLLKEIYNMYSFSFNVFTL